MYGSTHTHFESMKDTANNLENMCKNFIKLGAKKVAVTEHGVMSSYEDIKDAINHINQNAKKKGEPISDFEVIPGCEVYFGDAHLILIAKNYQGYYDLCKIITEANRNIKNGKPTVTSDILKQYVTKGDMICTSACIAGPFGRLMGLNEANAKEKLHKAEEILNKNESIYIKNMLDRIEEYEANVKEAKAQRPLKKDEKDALKRAKHGDESRARELEERRRIADELDIWVTDNTENYNKAIAYIKDHKKQKLQYTHALDNQAKYSEELRQIRIQKNNGEIEIKCKDLLKFFIDTFGEEDFYLELQGHGLDKENLIYNNIVDFAKRNNFMHFIASNDIHLGVTKDDEKYENARKRRNVAKFSRFNKYVEETPDDLEYTIKDNDELKEAIMNTLTCEDKEEIIDNAINNIEHALSECHIEFPKDVKYFPKFCDNENELFEQKVREGIKSKFPNGFPKGKENEYEDRIEYEIGVIKRMGYAGYHLIVSDYIQYGRLLGYIPEEDMKNAPLSVEELDKYITEKGYPRIGYNIGPGRGSAVGSICCYLLGITDIDPIPYELLFERKQAA